MFKDLKKNKERKGSVGQEENFEVERLLTHLPSSDNTKQTEERVGEGIVFICRKKLIGKKMYTMSQFIKRKVRCFMVRNMQPLNVLQSGKSKFERRRPMFMRMCLRITLSTMNVFRKVIKENK